MELIKIEHLTFYYPDSEVPAIRDVSLSVAESEFVVLCGTSGCGKSTLLSQLRPVEAYGIRSGAVYLEGKEYIGLSDYDRVTKIGFVTQSVDNQIATDKVWHELAFGLESLGMDTPAIRRKVAEMASFFGIQNWFYKNVEELSGGQKQLLNLASVMVMQPKILILDEPTSQLDPIAATEFLSTLQKINQELGTTILLTEHRLEEVLPMATKVLMLEEGQLLMDGTVEELGMFLKEKKHPFFMAMPSAMQIWGSVTTKEACAITVKEGKEFLKTYVKEHPVRDISADEKSLGTKVGIAIEDGWFRYEKDSSDVVKGVNFQAYEGEIFAILGGNGTGKSTTLKLLAGYYKPYRGSVCFNGKVCLLPQNPQILFRKKTVLEDLQEVLKEEKIEKSEREKQLLEILELCQLEGLEKKHPYDLSGGEQQRLALAKVLLLKPDVLLLDEPTKGLDVEFKIRFAEILSSLCNAGVCVVMVSHDIEFCAKYAHRCALYFDGNIVAEDGVKNFFGKNHFYTTAASRIARDTIEDAITTEEIIEAIGGKPYVPQRKACATSVTWTRKEERHGEEKRPLSWQRKLCAWIFGAVACGIFLYAIKITDLSMIINQSGVTKMGKQQLVLYVVFSICLIGVALSVHKHSDKVIYIPIQKDDKRLSKRTKTAALMIVLLIPFTLFVSVVYIGIQNYYIISVIVLAECILPFVLMFEKRKPQARELVLIACLCGICVAGRTMFFMLPQFKPVMALTILSGVALGGEVGFLVGAMSMLLSNVLFSQGPWTPWQMFAMGIIGFLSGVLYQKGWLRRDKGALCIFGVLCAVLIYGGIMNPAAALIWGSESLNKKMLMSYYLTGFPMDCVHASATGIFLWFLSDGMLEKLERIKTKYNLIS